MPLRTRTSHHPTASKESPTMVPLKRKPQTVLITGASSGIGLALALEFHSRGLHVFATAREPSKIQHLADLGIRTLALEVTSASSIAAAADLVSAETGGKLDFLVNNAGMGYSMPLLDSDLDVARRVYEINVFGLVAVTKAFAPLVIASKGKVANISSIASKAAIPYMGECFCCFWGVWAYLRRILQWDQGGCEFNF